MRAKDTAAVLDAPKWNVSFSLLNAAIDIYGIRFEFRSAAAHGRYDTIPTRNGLTAAGFRCPWIRSKPHARWSGRPDSLSAVVGDAEDQPHD